MKRALLIGGGVLALAVSGWYFFLRKAQPPANNKPKSSGITLADFDPTSKSAAYGGVVKDISSKLLDKWF